MRPATISQNGAPRKPWKPKRAGACYEKPSEPVLDMRRRALNRWIAATVVGDSVRVVNTGAGLLVNEREPLASWSWGPEAFQIASAVYLNRRRFERQHLRCLASCGVLECFPKF